MSSQLQVFLLYFVNAPPKLALFHAFPISFREPSTDYPFRSLVEIRLQLPDEKYTAEWVNTLTGSIVNASLS